MALELVEHQITIGLNEDALSEWIEYREEKKKPLSPLALKKVKNIMLRNGMEHQQYMVDMAISNDWQGLHNVEPEKKFSTRQTTIENDLNDRSWV